MRLRSDPSIVVFLVIADKSHLPDQVSVQISYEKR
jgi:hypothetical protein